MNVRRVGLKDGTVHLGGATLSLSPEVLAAAKTAQGKEVIVGLRPESLVVATADTPGAMPLRVTLVEQLGPDSYVHGVLPDDEATRDKPFVVRVDGRYDAVRGETLFIAPQGPVEHAFDAESGVRLG